jgi:hypothetical protein
MWHEAAAGAGCKRRLPTRVFNSDHSACVGHKAEGWALHCLFAANAVVFPTVDAKIAEAQSASTVLKIIFVIAGQW